MTKIALLLGTRDLITLRRYLLLLKPLSDRGISCVIVDAGKISNEIVEETKRHLGVTARHEYRPLTIPAATTPCEEVENLPRLRKNPSFNMNRIEDLLAGLDVDIASLIGSRIKRLFPHFQTCQRAAAKLLDELEPSCLLFNIELPMPVRALLWQCRKRGIATVSMEHAEGYGEQYGFLPCLGDYHIAYGEHNREALLHMGAPTDRIFVTGAPDTDLLYRLDRPALKRSWRSRMNLQGDKPLLLVALKPDYLKTYARMNTWLLETCQRVLTMAAPHDVLIKIHPVDGGTAHERIAAWCGERAGFYAVEGSAPMLEMLAISDRFLTFKSAALVEALLLDVPLLLLDQPDHGVWPAWGRFGVYRQCEPDRLEAELALFLDHPRAAASAHERNAREDFIRHFRYKIDDGAAQRVVTAIGAICGG